MGGNLEAALLLRPLREGFGLGVLLNGLSTACTRDEALERVPFVVRLQTLTVVLGEVAMTLGDHIIEGGQQIVLKPEALEENS